ncbi:hypothetical protein GH714_029670 [Hevea brasiliensis]|uniref:AT-hook motif nuclear-localized protein n=1 Tax=Hevea brasiliensis TaxID=3981 RepID=A0A6A6M5C3_HEVBR|nr:hypothetical protein GH714_029670 [Hevea brasiliensis]
MPQVMTINMNMAAENMSMERSLIATTTPPTTGIDGSDRGSGHPASGSEDLIGKKNRVRPKKCRGRPPGSGNWQLLASLGFDLEGELFANTAGGDFTPHVDVAGKILAIAQKGPRRICILSANGAVSNVTISQPGSSGGILTMSCAPIGHFCDNFATVSSKFRVYLFTNASKHQCNNCSLQGRFEIISLSGSFTVTETGGVRSRTGGLSVSLASPDGRVMGCGIAGLLLAASPIQLHLPNEIKAHKRKHHRENAIGSGIPVGAQEVPTEARPISEAKPVGETCLISASSLPEQSHEGADNSASDQRISNAANPFTSCLNGSQHM